MIVNSLNTTLLTVILIFTCSDSWSGEISQDTINNIEIRKKEILEKINTPENIHEQEGKSRAENIMNNMNSNEYQNRLRAETNRLKATVFKDQVASQETTTTGSGLGRNDRLAADERLYVFVSSSMPLKALRRYAASIDGIGDPNISMVMRGFVGGMKQWDRMMNFSSKILVKNASCDAGKDRCETFAANMQVDPMLFRRYGIKAVPTVVFARGVTSRDPSMSEGVLDVASVSSFTSISGDMSLEYLLSEISAETGSISVGSLLIKSGGNHPNGN